MTVVFKHGYSAYTNHGCRCDTCRTDWRLHARRRRGTQPSLLALEVAQLTAELDAAEARIDALQEENARLRCELDETQGPP